MRTSLFKTMKLIRLLIRLLVFKVIILKTDELEFDDKFIMIQQLIPGFDGIYFVYENTLIKKFFD